MKTAHFEVDRAGLAKLLARRGIEFAVLELIQNALDEKVSAVRVDLVPAAARGCYRLVVEDNSPEGFADLRHAYTLFAESKKKTDATKRGRFNLGEKLVIAVAKETTIRTTKGTIRFDDDGRHASRSTRDHGTEVDVLLRMTHEEAARTTLAVQSVLVPADITLVFNGVRQPSRTTLHVLGNVALPTEIADEEGYLRTSTRNTTVEIFEPHAGEVPTLYELGIPVVETGDQWHVSIGQKVPLNSDRDNVTPAYLRRVRTLVLDAMHERLTPETAAAPWVTAVLADADAEAVTAVLTQRYGEKRVVRDPSDPEGTKLAMSRGYAIIEPGSFSRDQWTNIRASGAALPAGQVTPSPKPYAEEGGREQNYIPREKWSSGLLRFEQLAQKIAFNAAVLPPGRLHMQVVSDVSWPYAATYGRGGELIVNLGRLGHRFFDAQGRDADIARAQLLVHEFGHEFSSDHLSSEYHDALCRIGARLFLFGGAS